jgi:transcriptional regulator with XRE-family HTH domain/tetratricopeptide (TPR) repeat protein
MVVSSSDTPLRQARTRRGWSLREAARELRLRAAEVGRPLPGPEVLVSMISRWELGRHLPGPFYRWLFSEVYAIPEAALFGMDDVNRRQFAVVALGAAVDAIVPSAPLRREPEPTRPPRQSLEDTLGAAARESIELSRQVEASELGPTTLEHLELTVERLGLIFLNTPPEQVSEELGWHRHRATELLTGKQTLAERRHLYVALGWLTGLLGHLAFDLGHYSAARTHCLTALQLAHEADHRELGAWIRSLQAMIALYSGWFQEAADLAWAGEELAMDGTVGRVQLPVLAARAYARLGDHRGADAAVHRAEEAFERLSNPARPESVFSVDAARVPFCAGTAYVWLGQPRRAEIYSRRALALYDAATGTTRWPANQALARCDLAMALLQLGEVEEACWTGGEALAIFRERRADSVLRRAHEFRAALAGRSYQALPAARAFSEQLRTVAPRHAPTGHSTPSGADPGTTGGRQ